LVLERMFMKALLCASEVLLAVFLKLFCALLTVVFFSDGLE
jgi:hypothetical protein